jgi:tetratricopeptide (TPR) repeat protein
MYEAANDLNGQADTLNSLALDHYDLGEWQAAADRYGECLQMASQIGDAELLAIVHNNLGEVFLCQGDLSRAKAEFRWTIDARNRLT